MIQYSRLGIPIINATNLKLNNQKLENEILSQIDVDDLVEKYGLNSKAIVGKVYS